MKMPPAVRPESACTLFGWLTRARTLPLVILPLLLMSLPSPRVVAETDIPANPTGSALSAEQVQASEGLVAHWPLDEGAGTTTFDAAGTYAGTLMNGAVWASGRLGAAVRLDGTAAYVAPPALDVYGSSLTLAAWVKVVKYPGSVEQRIISKATGTSEQAHYWMLSQVRSGGRNLLQFRLKTSGSTTTLVAS
ncbi:MAG: hypothetical protein H0W08_21665, partial [Acidobacteria bacterium]|nr:hypothetical protein [Acidobacteriota bacterium]